MASFRFKFEAGLAARRIEVTHDPDGKNDAILVIAGTRNLIPLWRARRRGVRVVQRLDAINWVHRRRFTGLRHFIRAEYGNFMLSFIRSRIASHIVYQSQFSRRWWEDWYGKPDKPSFIVLNGVDLDFYQPQGSGGVSPGRYRVLIVEGNLGGGYDMGLENAL